LFANDRIRFISGLYDGTAINALRVSQNKDDHGQVFNTRLSAAPYYGDEGRYVLHFGGHYTYLADVDSRVRVQPGGSNWLAYTLDTAAVPTNHHHRSGIEAAYQDGPFAIHSEAFFAQFGGNVDKTAKGFSTEFTYFLGGEHRAYSLTSGTFGAVKMKNNFHPFESGGRNLVDGFGAWQLVLQYGYTDLGDWRTDTRDSGNRGGLQSDVTFGVNWFWTPNVRWIFEYTNSQQNTGTDYVHTNQDIFGTSLRIFF
jgi:phosphate-selective porin OprO/OprP